MFNSEIRPIAISRVLRAISFRQTDQRTDRPTNSGLQSRVNATKKGDLEFNFIDNQAFQASQLLKVASKANKADRHKSRAPSIQQRTDQLTDQQTNRQTDRQNGLQSCVHATKKQLELAIFVIFQVKKTMQRKKIIRVMYKYDLRALDEAT